MLYIRFDGGPGPMAGRFIEVERDGKSINYGEWKQDGEDWLLIIPDTDEIKTEKTRLFNLLIEFGCCLDWGEQPDGKIGPCHKCDFCKFREEYDV